ncbi:MAG TPA: hypothetical protein VE093_40225 [Polyangiaceae bacterium]|nr:hypothetical protein [Polyangiaceae bacterium]
MFRIRREQMDTLAKSASADYRRRLKEWLVAEFPESFEGLDQGDIDAWVDDAVTRSEGHGIALERETTQLVALYLLLGLDADEALPWFKEALSDSDLIAEGKVRKLLESARREGVEGVDRVDILSDERAA